MSLIVDKSVWLLRAVSLASQHHSYASVQLKRQHHLDELKEEIQRFDRHRSLVAKPLPKQGRKSGEAEGKEEKKKVKKV